MKNNKVYLFALVAFMLAFSVFLVGCNSNPFIGTWTVDLWGDPSTLTITKDGWSMPWGSTTYSGTYTRDKNTATLVDNDGDRWTATVSGKTMNLSSNATPFVGTWTGDFWGDPSTLTIADNGWSIAWGRATTYTGTYTRNKNTATLVDNDGDRWTAVVSGRTMNLSLNDYGSSASGVLTKR